VIRRDTGLPVPSIAPSSTGDCAAGGGSRCRTPLEIPQRSQRDQRRSDDHQPASGGGYDYRRERGNSVSDVEDTAGHWLPALRLSHLAGLLLLVAGSLAVVTVAWQVADIQWSLVRDLALFAGLALLRAGLAGSGLAWILPAGYAFAAFLATILTMGPTQQQLGWTWSLHAAREWEAAVAAAILLLAGLGLVVWRGARDNLGERA